VGEHPVTYPAMTAQEWLAVVGAPDFPLLLLEGVDSAEVVPVLRSLASGTVTLEDVRAAAYEALAAAAGMPWWKAARLVGWAAAGYWGELVLRGVDPSRLSLAAWCAAAWALVRRGRDEVGLLKIEAQFDVPPVGETDESAWAMDPSEFPPRA
jgi:hypothetical protein